MNYLLFVYMFQHYFGRARNCYKIAIIKVEKALSYATIGRKQKKKDMVQV